MRNKRKKRRLHVLPQFHLSRFLPQPGSTSTAVDRLLPCRNVMQSVYFQWLSDIFEIMLHDVCWPGKRLDCNYISFKLTLLIPIFHFQQTVHVPSICVWHKSQESSKNMARMDKNSNKPITSLLKLVISVCSQPLQTPGSGCRPLHQLFPGALQLGARLVDFGLIALQLPKGKVWLLIVVSWLERNGWKPWAESITQLGISMDLCRILLVFPETNLNHAVYHLMTFFTEQDRWKMVKAPRHHVVFFRFP